ncbi:MAG: glycosyltransferase family 39 protein, partial [Bacteroidota bacterium]
MSHPTIIGLIRSTPALWGIFGLAIVVRLVLLVTLHDSYYTAGMAQGELARNIAEGRGFVVNEIVAAEAGRLQDSLRRLVDVEDVLAGMEPHDSPEHLRPFIAYMMPGQGILLAGTYRLFGEYRYIYLQSLQVVVDSIGVFLLFWLGTMLFGAKVGLITSLLFAVYIPEARLAISATRDAWMPILYLSSACALVFAWKADSPKGWLILGLCVAVGAYFRSEILLLPFFALAVKFIIERRIQPVLKPALLALLPIVLLITPWSIRNSMVFDRILPTNSGLWLAMWQSFGEYENDFGAVNNDVVTFQQTREWGYTAAFDTPEYDDIFRARVLQVVSERPVWVAWTVIRRLARIPFQMHAWGISSTEDMVPGNESYPVGKVDVGSYWNYITGDPLRFITHLIARGVNVVLYASVAIWFFSIGRNARLEGLLLLIVPLYNILVHAVIGVHAR